MSVSRRPLSRFTRAALVLLQQPVLLTFAPALGLGWYWFGAIGALWIGAIAVPLVAISSENLLSRSRRGDTDSLTGLKTRNALIDELDEELKGRDTLSCAPVVVVIEVDEFPALMDIHGTEAAEEIVLRTGERLRMMMRGSDMVSRLVGHRFAVLLPRGRRLDMEATLQLAERIQQKLGEPLSINASTVYLTTSVGLCLARRLNTPTGDDLLEAAETALEESIRHGGSTVRTYSDAMQKSIGAREDLIREVEGAFDDGQIIPWFQPQINCDTGIVTGMEALARWKHPDLGLIPPADFLDAIEAAGMMHRLGEVMLFHSLAALHSWDRAGYDLETVSVNFSDSELKDPQLMEKVRWDLDRFDIAADRLAIEVLEDTVAMNDRDSAIRNIQGLAAMGCMIDMDDFGTGHASISNIRRFAIKRIKIDRSFVARIDEEPEQKKFLAAILTMSQQLGMTTLAEGVETIGEFEAVTQMGCDYLQGYALARPMPFEETIGWMEEQRSKLEKTPKIPSAKRSG